MPEIWAVDVRPGSFSPCAEPGPWVCTGRAGRASGSRSPREGESDPDDFRPPRYQPRHAVLGPRVGAKEPSDEIDSPGEGAKKPPTCAARRCSCAARCSDPAASFVNTGGRAGCLRALLVGSTVSEMADRVVIEVTERRSGVELREGHCLDVVVPPNVWAGREGGSAEVQVGRDHRAAARAIWVLRQRRRRAWQEVDPRGAARVVTTKSADAVSTGRLGAVEPSVRE
jgi:hypothetical protein